MVSLHHIRHASVKLLGLHVGDRACLCVGAGIGMGIGVGVYVHVHACACALYRDCFGKGI